jgi:hypothetical protein
MTDKKIWLVTGAARCMGVDIANAALAAGHAVGGTPATLTPSPPLGQSRRACWRCSSTSPTPSVDAPSRRQ